MNYFFFLIEFHRIKEIFIISTITDWIATNFWIFSFGIVPLFKPQCEQELEVSQNHNNDNGNNIVLFYLLHRRFYDRSVIAVKLTTLSILNAQLYITYDPDNLILSYSHIAITVVCYLVSNSNANNYIIFSNIASLAYISSVSVNYWGLSTTILCVINNFIVPKLSSVPDVVKIKYFNSIAMIFFSIFFINTVEN